MFKICDLNTILTTVLTLFMKVFGVCCPLVPLMPEGEGYPDGYQLPKRQRPQDSLNIPKLCEALSDSILYERKFECLNFAVIGVLSPYSPDLHVMVAELSPNRYLPGPESFTNPEFNALCALCSDVLAASARNEFTVQCVGYNWSPFAWGHIEERGGCQSVMTKFHMMMWQWNKLDEDSFDNLSPKHKEIFELNNYNEPFAKLVWAKCGQFLAETGLFSDYVVNSRGLFVKFGVGKCVSDVLQRENFLREFSVQIQGILAHLSSCLTDLDLDKMLGILMKTNDRMLTDIEIEELRRAPNPRSLEDVLQLCNNDDERQLCSDLYDSVLERCGVCDTEKTIWEKGFGYSLVMCDSENDFVSPGLYVGLHAHCGPGGVAEVVGCHLTRPEGFVAAEGEMIAHNQLLWNLGHSLLQ